MHTRCTHTHTHGLQPGQGSPQALEPPGPTLTCDVVHHHGHRGVPDVAGDQAAEPLLARCVPELQSHLWQGGQGVSRGSGVLIVGVGAGGGPGSMMLALPALGQA